MERTTRVHTLAVSDRDHRHALLDKAIDGQRRRAHELLVLDLPIERLFAHQVSVPGEIPDAIIGQAVRDVIDRSPQAHRIATLWWEALQERPTWRQFLVGQGYEPFASRPPSFQGSSADDSSPGCRIVSDLYKRPWSGACQGNASPARQLHVPATR